MGLDAVGADALEPWGSRPRPRPRASRTPARRVSTIASPTEASRLRWRSTIAATGRMPLGLGVRRTASPGVVASLRSWRACGRSGPPGRPRGRRCARAAPRRPGRRPPPRAVRPARPRPSGGPAPPGPLRPSPSGAAIGPGTDLLLHASCLDNSNRTVTGHALLAAWALCCCQSAQRIVRYPCPWDHPRIRGEHRRQGMGAHRLAGIIPACAGSTARLPDTSGTRSGSSQHARGALSPSLPPP